MRTLAGALMWSLVPPPRAALRSSHTRSAEEHDKGITFFFFFLLLACSSFACDHRYLCRSNRAGCQIQCQSEVSRTPRCDSKHHRRLFSPPPWWQTLAQWPIRTAPPSPPLLPRLIVKDDKSDPCVRRAGVDTSSKRLADVPITFLLVPTVWRKTVDI